MRAYFREEILEKFTFLSFPQSRVVIPKIGRMIAKICDKVKCRYCRKCLMIPNLKMSHEWRKGAIPGIFALKIQLGKCSRSAPIYSAARATGRRRRIGLHLGGGTIRSRLIADEDRFLFVHSIPYGFLSFEDFIVVSFRVLIDAFLTAKIFRSLGSINP